MSFFSNIIEKINPVNWFKKPLKRKVISTVIGIIKKWVRDKVSYQPLNDYIITILRRIEDIIPAVVRGEDRREVMQRYWESHKTEIITEQARMLKSIADAEVKDKELVQIIKRTIQDLDKWKSKRI